MVRTEKDQVMTERLTFAEEDLERCISRVDEIIDEDTRLLGVSKENAQVFGEDSLVVRQRQEESLRNLLGARQSPCFGCLWIRR